MAEDHVEGDDIDLASLSDDDLVAQMHDDLYDGLKEEIEEGTHILLGRGWAPKRVLDEALVEGVGLRHRVDIVYQFVDDVNRGSPASRRAPGGL